MAHPLFPWPFSMSQPVNIYQAGSKPRSAGASWIPGGWTGPLGDALHQDDTDPGDAHLKSGRRSLPRFFFEDFKVFTVTDVEGLLILLFPMRMEGVDHV